MGRGQVVRQRVLVPLLGGSNPSVPDFSDETKDEIVLYPARDKRKFIRENNYLL